jgi:proteic killer suppression protein
MLIRSIRHKGLRGLIEGDNTSGIRQDLVNRVRRVVTALVLAEDMTKLLAPPGWRIHQLSGDRAGEWSVSVSGNWRITFEVRDDEIWSLGLEDYH